MMILDPNSLMKTVDHINELLLTGHTIPPEEGLKAARWMTTRQGEKGAYRTLYAPTSLDFERGIHTFTGDKLTCASARHVLGQEAARAVWLLGRQDPSIRAAYDRAVTWMHDHEGFHQTGTFCCGRCTPAFWRHIWVGDFANKEKHLARGLNTLSLSRDENGKWGRYSFFYTIYALLDMDLEPAYRELRYACPAMEKSLRATRSGVYSQRRKLILEKALDKVN